MKVTLNSIKEVIVFNTHRTTVEELTKQEAISSNPILMWCNRILFNVSGMNNDQYFLQQLEGVECLDTLTYAISDKITESSWNGYRVEVQDMTGHSLYDSMTKDLK